MVSWLSQNVQNKLMVAGATFISDAYPNLKYKIEYLVKRQNFTCNIFNLINNKKGNTFYKSNKKILIFQYIAFSFVSFLVAIKKRPHLIYLPYPGLVLTVLYFLYPPKKRPRLFLDAFISIYDTVVIDRKIITRTNYLAKILYVFEKLAFSVSTIVITDTKESSLYLSNLFDIPIEKFKHCTLAQTPVQYLPKIITKDPVLKCIFIGTFIPLQGVDNIARAICKLRPKDNIHIKLIGNGQTAPKVENILKNADKTLYSWEKRWINIDQLNFEIQNADLCLGIFGDTAKAKRVWPYKNYLYLSAGCPVATFKTTCAETLQKMDIDSPILFPEFNTPESLVQLLKKLSKSKQLLFTQRQNARKFYENYLSNKVAFKELMTIFNEI